MVVYHGSYTKIKKMESRNLKFGVDRILSEEICSNTKKSEVNSSILSCCACVPEFLPERNSSFSFSHFQRFHKPEILIPRPFRPFANVLFSTEPSVHSSKDEGKANENSAKRKRSWSRAVFSNLQRKGLEKRFQLQKYITKPDRRQLAATLGLTDAQVKVWFQNRRMKWRHTREPAKSNLNTNEANKGKNNLNVDLSADSTLESSLESDGRSRPSQTNFN